MIAQCHPNRKHFAKGRCSSCYWAFHRHSIPNYIREKSLQSRYKIGVEDYEKLKQKQNGVCAICKKPSKRLVVDHNHKTKQVRGLLCDLCNSFLGKIETNFTIFSTIYDYLHGFDSSNFWSDFDDRYKVVDKSAQK